MNNLAELLAQWQSTPQLRLYRQYVDQAWRDYDAAAVLALAARWQGGYRQAGLQPGDRVALCLRNGVQWAAADLAAHGLGLVVVPLYVDDNADNMAWCIEDAGAKLLIADHLRFLPLLQQALRRLPQIVLLRGEASGPAIAVEDWLPAQATAQFVVEQHDAAALATIVYTSGTLGRPKGVVLSHRNILANVAAILEVHPIHQSDVLLSVLPLSHMFERTGGYYLPLCAGACVTYCRGISELAQDMAEQRPTVIMAVPRLFERMLARIDERLAQSRLQRFLFYLAARAGWRRFKGQARMFDALLIRLLHPRIAVPLRQRMGGRLRQAVMGGAALDRRVAETLMGLGVPLLQGYGLTEASPVVAVNRCDNNDPASVGEPLPGIEVRLGATGELLVRSPMVMQGYWGNAAATQQVIDEAGWLNTGDIVEIRQQRIYIRGRSKNILVLSNGEKVAPEDVEGALMQDPAFGQVMVVGEARPYLVLLAVSADGDEQSLLRRANECIRHLPRYARIRRVIVLKESWSTENGLLTPTLKVKRQAVYTRYLPQIEEVYRSA
jgi:long-chain acyl-CoA synthetase